MQFNLKPNTNLKIIILIVIILLLILVISNIFHIILSNNDYNIDVFIVVSNGILGFVIGFLSSLYNSN